MRAIFRLQKLLLGLILLFAGLLLHIHVAARRPRPSLARRDVAIVLGTAVSGETPSPVFETRIRHGIWLLEHGRVDRLLFTGGLGMDGRLAEAEVACRFAAAQGVPPDRILCETRSTTTLQNLIEATALMHANGLHRAYLVSDPLHLQRGMRMARDLGLDVAPAATPFSPHNNLQSYAGYLLYEGLCTAGYLIGRELRFLPGIAPRPGISHAIHNLVT